MFDFEKAAALMVNKPIALGLSSRPSCKHWNSHAIICSNCSIVASLQRRSQRSQLCTTQTCGTSMATAMICSLEDGKLTCWMYWVENMVNWNTMQRATDASAWLGHALLNPPPFFFLLVTAFQKSTGAHDSFQAWICWQTSWWAHGAFDRLLGISAIHLAFAFGLCHRSRNVFLDFLMVQFRGFKMFWLKVMTLWTSFCSHLAMHRLSCIWSMLPRSRPWLYCAFWVVWACDSYQTGPNCFFSDRRDGSSIMDVKGPQLVLWLRKSGTLVTLFQYLFGLWGTTPGMTSTARFFVHMAQHHLLQIHFMRKSRQDMTRHYVFEPLNKLWANFEPLRSLSA